MKILKKIAQCVIKMQKKANIVNQWLHHTVLKQHNKHLHHTSWDTLWNYCDTLCLCVTQQNSQKNFAFSVRAK